MPAYFRFPAWKRSILFPLFVCLTLPLFSQTISVPDGTIGLRHEFTESKGGDSFTLDNMKPGEFYTLMLVNEDECYPQLKLQNENSGVLTQDENLLQIQPERDHVVVVIDSWATCKKEQGSFYLSVNCETCDNFEIQLDEESRMMNLSTAPQSAQSLITDVFIGGGCFDVQNVQGSGSFGYFSNGGLSVGFEDGVILSTGDISTAPGPNNSGSTTGASSGGADADLQAIATANVTQTAIIEFDFRPTIDNVQFAYSFASEEYCEWVNSAFNDVFGFFISGPGIAGPFSNGAINIAELPDGTPVSINNVNHLLNTGYFVGNTTLCGGGPNDNISFDGWTVPLIAQAMLIPCETYHIKLAVGDVGDGSWDSAVFLGGNSFKAGSLGNIQADIPGLSADFQGAAIEDCGDGYIIFNRVGSPDGVIEIPLSINPASTATAGVDFTNIPTSVIIPEGVYSVLVPFSIFADGITEGLEFVIFDIESSCNCSVTSFTININDAIPIESTGSLADFCASENVVLNANHSGGVGPYTYEWNTTPAQFTPGINVTPNTTTTYTVTVTDECGNTTEADHIVEVAAIVSAEMSGQFDICGDFDQVDIPVVLQGPGPWTLEYSHNSVPQPPITNIFSSPYTLTITEPGIYNLISITSGGCDGNAFGQVQITEGELLYASDVNNISCNSTNDGSITLTPFGGSGGYSYLWENIASGSNMLTDLIPGTYNVTMTDGVGCSTDASFTLVQPVPPVVQSVVATDVDCDNPTGNIQVSILPGTGGFTTVTWDQGIGAVEDPTGLAPGTYTATVTDAAGCEIIFSQPIVGDLQPPDVAAAADGLFDCVNQSVDLSGAGSSTGMNFNYEWTNSLGGVVSTLIDYTTTDLDTYTFTVLNTDNGCEASMDVTPVSDVVDPVAIIVAPNQLNCTVLQTELNASSSTGNNALSYVWYNSSGVEVGTGPSINVSTSEIFTVSVTDDVNGCTDDEVVNVPQNINPPTSDAGDPGFLTCTMDQATLTGSGTSSSGQVNYSWVNENGVEEGITPSVTVSAAGTYTLIITDPQNGCTASSDAEVSPDENLPLVEVAESGTITCVNFDATITGAGSSTGSNFSYQWYDPGGAPLTTDVQTTVNQSGVYVLSITNTDNGCIAENSVLVPEDVDLPAVEAGVGGILTCTADQVELNGSSSDDPGGAFTYEWFNDVGTSVGNDPDLTVNMAGDYTLEVTGTNGCVQTDMASVTLDNDVPVADAGTPGMITCLVPDIPLGGPGTSTDAGLQYSWVNSSGTEVATSMNYTAADADTYTLTVFNPDNNCQISDDVIVTENVDIPEIDLGNPADLDCTTLTSEFGGTGTSSGAEFTYSWTDENDVEVSDAATFESMVPGTFTLLVTNTSNDCIISESISIAQDVDEPSADAGADEDFDCQTDELVFNADTGGNAGNTEYAWFDSDDVEVSNSSTLTTMNVGTFTLVVTNPDNGCTQTDDIVVGTAVDVPLADAGATGTISCTVDEILLGGSGTSTDPGLEYSWTDENDVEVANTPTYLTSTPGTYTLLVTNPANLCASSDDATVFEDIDIPTIDAGDAGLIDCINMDYELGGTNNSTGSEFEYAWTDENGIVVSNDINYTTTVPGNFTFQITNINNDCVIDEQVLVTEDVADPLANAGADADLDCVTTELTFNAETTGNPASVTYSWLNSSNVEVSNTPSFTTMDDDTYTLIVSNPDNGCSTDDVVVVNSLVDIPTADAGVTSTLTCTQLDYTVGGTSTSTDPGLQYSWMDENNVEVANTPTFLTNVPGSFTLTVFNPANNCEDSDQISVDSNVEYPAIDAGANGNLDCDDLTYELGGTGNSTGTEFSYQWTDENGVVLAATQNYTTSTPGNYTFQVLNTDNDCAVDEVVAVVQDILDPLADAGADANFNCITNTINLQADQNQNAANISYTWFDANNVEIGNTPDYDAQAEGSYNLLVTNTDNGCTATDEVVVGTDVDYPLADAGSTATIDCDNLSQMVGGTGTSTGGNFVYSWTDQNNTVVSNSLSFSTSTAGTFILNVINTDNFCETEANVVILENTLDPTVALGSGGGLDCVVESLILGDPGTSQGSNFTYNWSLNSSPLSEPSIYLPISQPGNYELLVTNTENGCTATESMMINQDIQTPGADAGTDGVFDCDDVMVDLLGSSSSSGANIEYAWYNSGGVQVGNNLAVQVGETGVYSLVVTNTANGCTSEDVAEIVPSADLPTALATNGTLTCAISDVNISASASFTSSGSIEYAWTDPNGVPLGNSSDIMTNVPGTYTVEITDPSNGCQATASVEVDQDIAPPTVDAGQDLVFDCNSDFLTLLGQAQGTGSLVYEWTDANGVVIGNSNTQQVDNTGTFTLSVLDQGNGCSAVDVVEVTPDIDLPTAVAGPGATLDCILEDFTLDAIGSSTGSNIQYTWLDENDNVLGTGSTYTVSTAGTYTLQVLDTDNGCDNDIDVLIEQDIAEPQPDIIPLGGLSLDCNNPQLTLDATGSTPAGSISFSWENIDNPGVVISTDPQLDLTEPGTYVLTLINNQNGCAETMQQIIVEDVSAPDLAIATPDQLDCVLGSVQLGGQDLNNISNALIEWSGSGPIVNGNTLTPSVSQPGMYTLTLTNLDNGCDDEYTVEVISEQEYPIADANADDILDCVTAEVGLSGLGSSEGSGFTYNWTGPGLILGSTTISPTVNTAGIYTLEVTNSENSCMTPIEVEVIEDDNEPVDLEAKVTPPPCAGDPGEIQIQSIEGGTGPYMYAVNGGSFTDTPQWQTLQPGTHTVYIEDMTGCTYEETVEIPITDPIQVILESELQVTTGQVLLTLGEQTGLMTDLINFDTDQYQTISWSPAESLSCSDCPNPIATPTETTVYKVTVTDIHGCPAEDDILLRVKTKVDIYIPNAFSPNGDGSNETFYIFAAEDLAGVEEIEEFIIADRWGEIVFRDQNFLPNDPAHGWNGRMKATGEPFNPAVFAYYARVKLINGNTQEFEGDVTLMK